MLCSMLYVITMIPGHIFTSFQSQTREQPSLVPDKAPAPNLHTEATAQSMNIDSSGLRICIPVLKRKREKE